MKNAIFKTFLLYSQICLFSVLIINYLDNNYNIFSDPYCISEISNNFKVIHAYLFTLTLSVLIHCTYYMRLKRNNIKLLSCYIIIPITPCLFLLMFYLEVITKMYGRVLIFSNNSDSYFHYGCFLLFYLTLISTTTFLAKLSTIHKGASQIECY